MDPDENEAFVMLGLLVLSFWDKTRILNVPCFLWAGNCVVRFRFNGLVSKPYFVNRGIPQGSPLSPFLFGPYVADIFEPCLRYSPSVPTLVSSYVDNEIILVASDSRDLTRYTMAELLKDCDRVARGRRMAFSAIKTKWIGFGRTTWEDLDIDGE